MLSARLAEPRMPPFSTFSLRDRLRAVKVSVLGGAAALLGAKRGESVTTVVRLRAFGSATLSRLEPDVEVVGEMELRAAADMAGRGGMLA
jgi:hypothetical protein